MSPTARSARRTLRRFAVALVTFGVIVAGGGTAYGVLGVELDDLSLDDLSLDRLTGGRSDDVRAGRVEPLTVAPPVDPPAERPAPPEEEPTAEPTPAPVLAPGDTGRQVRVDPRTWRRLVRMSAEPTRAQLFNEPGPRLLGPGDDSRAVRELEARLRQIAWFFGDVDNVYDARTVEAVEGFQAKRGIPVTGEVDRRTLDLLEGMSTEPTADSLANRPYDPADGAPLDPRCLSVARALCIDKSTHSLRWVVDGKVRSAVDVRFGSAELPTREGAFSVYRKSRDHVSSLYGTPMPYSMFFSGGQAVHYSPDFAANGYNGASHGCVNVRDYSAIAALFDQVPLGTRVVVHWS